jgi:hypothetical protein
MTRFQNQLENLKTCYFLLCLIMKCDPKNLIKWELYKENEKPEF